MSTDADKQGDVRLSISGAVAMIEFDRPHARNAMTWTMYEGLANACDKISSNTSLRVAVLRGVGGKAFIAGTDIAQFLSFETGDDGIAYEKQVEKFVSKVERLNIPTIAVVEGCAVGGGLAIANACDFRIATTGAKFGAPIARTLGNCLSARNLDRLVATLGLPMVKRMLMLADLVEAEELMPLGYLLNITSADEIDKTLSSLCERLSGNAPVTMRVTKQALLRLSENDPVKDEDLIRECYGSDDFHHGVTSFIEKKPTQWKGR